MRSATVGTRMTCFSTSMIRVTEDRLMKSPKALWVSLSLRWRHKLTLSHNQNKFSLFSLDKQRMQRFCLFLCISLLSSMFHAVAMPIETF